MKEFFKELDEYIDNLEDKKNEIPILNFVLSKLGEIPEEVLEYICKKTGIWEITIKNTINFYPKYQVKKTKGDKVSIVYCSGRNCKERSLEILEKLKEDKELFEKVQLKEKNCFGCCPMGPVMEIDGLLYYKINLEKIKRALKNS